jgi:hypothetical protein
MNDPKKPNEEPGQPIAKTGKKGEGSYEGTKKYQEGYQKFSQQTSPEDARKRAEKIDPNDPSLKEAEKRGKEAGERLSSPSVP